MFNFNCIIMKKIKPIDMSKFSVLGKRYMAEVYFENPRCVASQISCDLNAFVMKVRAPSIAHSTLSCLAGTQLPQVRYHLRKVSGSRGSWGALRS